VKKVLSDLSGCLFGYEYAILRNDEKEESMCVSCCHIVEVVNLRWSFSFVPTTIFFFM